MITRTSTLSEPRTDGSTRKQCRKIQQERRSLQILDGHLGILELIRDYVGLFRGKKFRTLHDFNDLLIENTANSSDDDVLF